MSKTITLHRRVRFGRPGTDESLKDASPVTDVESAGRLPRVTRLMALAIRLEGLLAHGEVPSGALLAEVGQISRARLTQITNLTLLAPDIQEALLLLPPVVEGRNLITERDLRPIVAESLWRRQREMWSEFVAEGSNRQSTSPQY